MSGIALIQALTTESHFLTADTRISLANLVQYFLVRAEDTAAWLRGYRLPPESVVVL